MNRIPGSVWIILGVIAAVALFFAIYSRAYEQCDGTIVRAPIGLTCVEHVD